MSRRLLTARALTLTGSALLALLLTLGAARVDAQPRSRYAGLKPAELLERSRQTPSASERVAMRVLLAADHPKTPEGLFARAWVARYEGDAAQHQELLQACVAQAPTFPPCVAELADLQDAPARVAAYARLLQSAPDYNNQMPLRNLYFAQITSDRPGAEALLKAWEGKPQGVFIVPFIRGLDAEHNAKDYAAAERLYQQALQAQPRHFEPYRALAWLRLHRLSDGRTPMDQRLGMLGVVFDFIAARQREPASWQRDQVIAEAWLWIGDQARDTFKDHPGAFLAYTRSFEAWPSGEAAARAGEAARHYDQALRERTLLDAHARLPQHALILGALGFAFQSDPARAERFYRDAVAAAWTPADATAPTRFLGKDVLEARLDFDGAVKLYRAQMARVKNAGDLPFAIYGNRLRSRDYAAAAEALRAMAARPGQDLQSPWYQDRLREVEKLQRLEEERAAFYRANPFLEQWRARWGESVRVRVSFASGSSAVAARDRGVLAELARALTAPGAEGYVFQIAGHTDDQGDAGANRALSKARADAVIRYLHATHKIPLERMSGYGAGEDAPLEPNTSAAGRAANRRVEIVPLGAVERPVLAVTGAMNPSGKLVASPDGRLLALGTTPVQLWDAQRGVKLRDLGRGARLAFSPNGRWVAAASSFTEAGGYRASAVFLYDALHGFVEAALPEVEVTALSWAPDGKRLVYVTTQSEVIIYSVEQRRRVAAWVLPGNTMPRAVHWTRDGRFILTGQASADHLLRWDAASGALVGKLPGVNWPHAISSSADGRYLVAADNARTLSVWDTQEKDALRQLKIPSLANGIVAHPTRPWVLVNDFGGGEHHKGLLVDLEALRVLATHESGGYSTSYAFSRDGDEVYVAGADRVTRLDGATLAPRGSLEGAASVAWALEADPRGGYALTLDTEGVHVWDVTTGRKAHRWAGAQEQLAPVEDAPGRFLSVEARAKEGQSVVWELDTATFTRRQVATLPRAVRALRARGGRIALITSAFAKPGQGESAGAMELLELKTGASLRRAEVPLITEVLGYGRAGGSWVSGFDVDLAREEFILSTGWRDGFGMGTTAPSYAHLYGFDGARRRTFTAEEPVTDASFRGERVVLVGDSASWSFERASGKKVDRLAQRRGERRVELPGAPAHLLVSGSGVRYVPDAGAGRELVAPGDDLVAAAAFPERNLLVWLRRDNTLGFFTLDTFAPRLQLAARRGDAWLAWAKDGAFTASLGGAQRAFWSIGDLLLPMDALASRFEQPALIRQRLEPRLAAEASPDKRTAPPNPAADLFAVPWTLELASPERAETREASWTLRARVTRAASGVEAPQLTFSIQGQELADARGFVREPPAPARIDELTEEFTRELPLQEGLNVIQVSVLHRGARLLTQTALITRVAGASAGATPTSDLYFLGIGVSAYKDPALNLSFSDKDAEALAKALQPQAGRLYRQVHTRLLLNSDVTPQRIQVELHEFLRQSTPQDTIILFIAGHGVQDNDQSLYFLTHDADPERPYTGVELGTLHAFLKKRPPNQKALLWLDICHAGAYNADVKRRGRVTVEDAIQQLADGAGLVVLASSTGREFSLESARFGGGHGAFSAALLEALDGRADGEGNRDGTLSTTELIGFVSRRVPELTQNQQHPTTPWVEHLRDFPVSVR